MVINKLANKITKYENKFCGTLFLRTFVPTKTINKMKNQINKLQAKFSNEIKLFGITEVFIVNGELYTTSNYDLPYELISKFESELI